MPGLQGCGACAGDSTNCRGVANLFAYRGREPGAQLLTAALKVVTPCVTRTNFYYPVRSDFTLHIMHTKGWSKLGYVAGSALLLPP